MSAGTRELNWSDIAPDKDLSGREAKRVINVSRRGAANGAIALRLGISIGGEDIRLGDIVIEVPPIPPDEGPVETGGDRETVIPQLKVSIY